MPMMTDRPGFTLIETLIAFAILAMAAGALYQTLGTAAVRRRAIGRETAAALLGQSVLARVGQDMELRASAADGPGWHLDITRHGDPATPALLVVGWDVVVTLPTGGGRMLRLSTIRLGGAPAPP